MLLTVTVIILRYVSVYIFRNATHFEETTLESLEPRRKVWSRRHFDRCTASMKDTDITLRTGRIYLRRIYFYSWDEIAFYCEYCCNRRYTVWFEIGREKRDNQIYVFKSVQILIFSHRDKGTQLRFRHLNNAKYFACVVPELHYKKWNEIFTFYICTRMCKDSKCFIAISYNNNFMTFRFYSAPFIDLSAVFLEWLFRRKIATRREKRTRKNVWLQEINYCYAN